MPPIKCYVGGRPWVVWRFAFTMVAAQPFCDTVELFFRPFQGLPPSHDGLKLSPPSFFRSRPRELPPFTYLLRFKVNRSRREVLPFVFFDSE